MQTNIHGATGIKIEKGTVLDSGVHITNINVYKGDFKMVFEVFGRSHMTPTEIGDVPSGYTPVISEHQVFLNSEGKNGTEWGYTTLEKSPHGAHIFKTPSHHRNKISVWFK